MAQMQERPYPNLRTWRAARDLSQRQAAQLLGVSQITYSRIERGVRAIKGQQAKKIMELTGVPLEILVGAA